MGWFDNLKSKVLSVTPTVDLELIKQLEDRGEYAKANELKKGAGFKTPSYLEAPLIKQPSGKLPATVKKQILYQQQEEQTQEAKKATTLKQIPTTLKEIFIPTIKDSESILENGISMPQQRTADLYIGNPQNLAALFKGMPEGLKEAVGRSASTVIRNFPLFQKLLPSPFSSIDTQKFLGEKKKEELAKQVFEFSKKPIFEEEKTPTTKLYREAGVETGKMVPQALVAGEAGKIITAGLLKYGSTIPTLKKYASLAGELEGWVVTGQVVHQPEEGSRAVRAMEDIGAVIGFKIGSYLLGRAVQPLKNLFATPESRDIYSRILKGEKVTLAEAEYANQNVKVGLGIKEEKPTLFEKEPDKLKSKIQKSEYLFSTEQKELENLRRKRDETIFSDKPPTDAEMARLRELEEMEIKTMSKKLNKKSDIELENNLKQEREAIKQMEDEVLKEMRISGGNDFADNTMQQGYDDFISLLKNPKMRNPRIKELIETGDDARLKNIIEEKGIATKSEIDQMLYSQKLNNDEVLDIFKARLMKENPGLLIGQKVARGAEIISKKPSFRIEEIFKPIKIQEKISKNYLIRLKKDLIEAIAKRSQFETLMNKVKILPKGRKPIQMGAAGEDIGSILKIGRGGGQRRIYREDLENLKNIKELSRYQSGVASLIQAGRNIFKPTIRTFEELGQAAKEAIYYPLRTAKKEYKIAYNNFLEEFKTYTQGMGEKESKKIMEYALSKEPEYKGLPVENLTPKEQKFYEWGRKKYDEMIVGLNVTRRANGQELIGKRQNYWTHLQELGFLDQLGFDIGRAPTSLINGWVKMLAPSFQFGKHRLGTRAMLNAFEALRTYTNAALKHQYIGGETGRLRMMVDQMIPDINMTTGEITPFKLSEKSPNAYKFLTEWLDAQTTNGRITIFGSQDLNTIMNEVTKLAVSPIAKNISIANLAGNISSTLIQPSAIANTVVKLGYNQTAKGIGEYARKGIEEAMQESEVLLGRIFDVYYKPEAGAGLVSLKTKLGDKLIHPLQWLDLQTAAGTWYAARDFAINTLKMEGKQAIRFADDIVIETQASADIMDVSPIQRTKIGKAFTLFQTYVINNFDFLINQFGHAENAQELALKLFRYISVGTAFNFLLKDGLGLNPPFPEFYSAGKEGYSREGIWGAAKEIGLEVAEQIPMVGGLARYGGSWTGAVFTETGNTYDDIRNFSPDKEHIARLSFDVATLAGMPGTKQIEKSTRPWLQKLIVRGGEEGLFGPKLKEELKFEDLSAWSKIKTVLNSVYNTEEAENLILKMNKYDKLTRDWKDEAENLKEDYVKTFQKDQPIDEIMNKVFEFNDKIQNELMRADEEGFLFNVVNGKELEKLINSYKISDEELNNYLESSKKLNLEKNQSLLSKIGEMIIPTVEAKEAIISDISSKIPFILNQNPPKNFEQTLLDAESSGGKDKRNEKLDAGKFGWLVGFTKGTYNDIILKAKTDKRYKNLFSKIDLNSKEGAVKSAIELMKFKNNRFNDKGKIIGQKFDNWIDIYVNLYNASKNKQAARKNFESKLK